ncbi:PLP-dependent aminotransferase family protein [Bradyrhizobium sp. CB82]|uniref:aminotransferase-like domain-containing protein n=1 Tax=Bradyrhizobium sp. CB82 TaxID=3039159 RepID=UPI0024B1ABB2|nr:PLP-dependent aminotransferase family protein [Bradyrhizobium sp. CB82]WFU40239.1 PLP-dependent aminotransferase family protein [Bradyrhizobium sp. CB82]
MEIQEPQICQAVDQFIDFTRSLPPEVPMLDAKLAGAIERLRSDRSLNRLIHGDIARGSSSGRLGGARYLSPRLGDAIDIECMITTNGTQSALLLLFYHLVGKGGRLLAERLSYGALRELAGIAGVELVGLDVDEDGILPDAFEKACRKGGVRALYCNPTVQNPTTAIMPLSRRLALADISRRYGVPIIEDEALGRLHPDAAPPIAKIAPDVVWYIMSATKGLAHGLRLAYVVGPSRAHCDSALAPVERLSFWTAAPLLTAAIANWTLSGAADLISAAIREENTAREAMARCALGRFGLVSKPGSMHVWLPLPAPWTSDGFARSAVAAGVLIRSAKLFAVDNQPVPNAVRLSLSTPSSRRAATVGITRIAALLDRGPAGNVSKTIAAQCG